LQGFDKVLSIYTDGSEHQQASQALQTNFYRFFLDVFVKRSGVAADEDTLDTLHETIRSVIKANQSNANWDWLDLSALSDAIFAEVSGIPYRVERHRLTVKTVT